MAHLWLVRHAQVVLAAGTCYGRLDALADASATHAAAAALAQALPQHIPVWHSPLQRCVQLVHALHAMRPDIKATVEPRITEIDFAAWEGRPWSSIARAAIDTWAADLAHHAPGGGEPLSSMLARVQSAWQDAAQLPHDVAWITHAGVARCVYWLQTHGMRRLPQSHEWPRQAPACGAWERVPLQALPS